jgi:membrane fusion protein (multidrug efflux system)
MPLVPRFVAVLLVVVIANFTLFAPVSPAENKPAVPPAVAVLATAVRVAAAAQEVDAIGNLLADESVIIRSEIVGRVSKLNFREGQVAREGLILIELDPAEYQAQIAQSESAVKLWEIKNRRGKELLAKKAISSQDYDEMQASLQGAQASLALARTRLDKTQLRAPFDGVLGLRKVSPGNFVDTGQDLVNLEAIDPLKIDLRIPERYAGLVKPGLPSSVRVDAYPGRVFTGAIYAIDPRHDEGSRSVSLRGRLPNPERLLRPGMFAHVGLVLSERAAALWTPEQAVVPMANGAYVYRIVDGKAALTKIETGARKDGEVEVTHGLKPDDVVITEGQMKLRDGAPVKIVDAGPGSTS